MQIFESPPTTINNDSIVLGDCIDVMTRINDKSIDAIITDLPYGTTNCAWDEVVPLAEMWEQYTRIAKDSCPIVLFSAQPFTSKVIASQIDLFRYCWYWEKERGTGFLNSKRQPMRVIEEICVFSKKPSTYNPQMTPLEKPYRHALPKNHSSIHKGGVKSIEKESDERDYVTYTHSHPKNLIKFSRDKAGRSLVPTQKPVALLEYLVKTYTSEGDVILDSTMGSGTTGVACQNLNRQFIGIEIDSNHFEIAKNRLLN